jgi:hypothetical protein
MLTYHPAFDIYHTVFRILKILGLAEGSSLERERVRMLDFILLFPQDLKNVRLPPGYMSLKNKHTENPYNQVPNRKRLFYQLDTYFETAVECLLSYELLNVESFKNGILHLTDKWKKTDLDINAGFIDDAVMQLIKDEFLKMSLTELKQRTNLIEYRYDVSQD